MDNAAKVFPSSRRKADAQVFRISCELYECIDPNVLQRAVDGAIGQFDLYRFVLKRGWFWYYLEDSHEVPRVREEYKSPCAPLYTSGKNQLLFEVTYFDKRINLEVFHALSDGTGAVYFLKSIVARYLSEKHGLKRPPDDIDASRSQLHDDSFLHHYDDTVKVRRTIEPTACRIRGRRLPDNRIEVITGHMSASAVLKQSHAVNASLTSYLCACFTMAVRENMPVSELRRPIVACVPVNLRRFFASGSMRNFFNTIYVPYQSSAEDDLTDVVRKINETFSERLEPERIRNNMNGYVALEDNIFTKFVPLPVKDVVLRLAYQVTEKKQTYSLSNIGMITVPPEFEPYIRAFDLCSSTNQLMLCMCSFGDTLSLSFTSPFINKDIERSFFRRLTSMGIDVEINAGQTGGID